MLLGTFSNLKINSENITVHEVPGKIEAEEFITNEGWVREDCTDAGAGFDMGYTDDGDFLDFLADVTTGGRYKVSYRVASGNSVGGKIDLEMVSGENEISKLHTLSVPNTNGWQNWTTIEREANLPKGQVTIRLLVNKREFNVNWLSFELLEATGVEAISKSNKFFSFYPNPASSKLNIDFSEGIEDNYLLKIISGSGVVVKQLKANNSRHESISLAGIKEGWYILQVSNGNKTASTPLLILSRNF